MLGSRYSVQRRDGSYFSTNDPGEAIRLVERDGLPYTAIAGMGPACVGGHLEEQVEHAHKAA